MLYLKDQDIITINILVNKNFDVEANDKVVKVPTALDSVIKNVQQTIEGKLIYNSIEECAAYYLRGLSQGHIFFNGNKRTAFLGMAMFLRLNGKQLNCTNEEAYQFTKQVAENRTMKVKIIASWIKGHCK